MRKNLRGSNRTDFKFAILLSAGAWRRAIIHGPITIFVACAILRERTDLTVVAFQRIEIRIGYPQHDVARGPLRQRNIGGQCWPRSREKLVRRIVDVTGPEMLDLLNPAAIDFQTNGDQRMAARASGRACKSRSCSVP